MLRVRTSQTCRSGAVAFAECVLCFVLGGWRVLLVLAKCWALVPMLAVSARRVCGASRHVRSVRGGRSRT